MKSSLLLYLIAGDAHLEDNWSSAHKSGQSQHYVYRGATKIQKTKVARSRWPSGEGPGPRLRWEVQKGKGRGRTGGAELNPWKKKLKGSVVFKGSFRVIWDEIWYEFCVCHWFIDFFAYFFVYSFIYLHIDLFIYAWKRRGRNRL